jgi:hypothetical protein
MKNFYRLFIYGASIHPGNMFYLAMIVFFGIVFSKNDTIGPVTGFFVGIVISFIVLAPLYIYTSYAVGKANAPRNDVVQNRQPTIKKGGANDRTANV